MSGQRPASQFDIGDYLTKNSTYTIKRLQAPGADVKNGTLVTWAGQNFGGAGANGLPDGLPRGGYVEEKLTENVITVAASEAVLVIQSPAGQGSLASSDRQQNHAVGLNVSGWFQFSVVLCLIGWSLVI